MEIHFVRGKSQIAHRQLVVWMGLVNQGFQPAVMLLAIGQTAADNGDMVALLEH